MITGDEIEDDDEDDDQENIDYIDSDDGAAQTKKVRQKIFMFKIYIIL